MSQLELRAAPRWVAAVSRAIRALPVGRYRAMNWIANRRTPPFWAVLPVDLGALRFHCDLRDPLMREVCMTGRYEPQETALIRRLLHPGMTFVDVGANWGYFTLGAAHLVGAAGRVVSVEADPRASHTLKVNVAGNALSNVTVIAAAASDVAQTINVRRYESSADLSSNFGVAFAESFGHDDARSANPWLQVPAKPLDAMLDEAGVDRVDLLKMDIEGAEGRALIGLGRRLSRGAIDRIILELHPAYLRNQGVEPEAIIGRLQSYGYAGWRIDHSPAVHRRAASTHADAASLLTPLSETNELGDWPHVLFARHGLDALSGPATPPGGGFRA